MTVWQPRLVALDIDGTLLAWVEGAGQTHEEITPKVYAAVHRAVDAGAHVVLASGRSPHGMDKIADLLLLMYNRHRVQDEERFEVFGDLGLAERWALHTTI